MTWISRAAGLHGLLFAACALGNGATSAGACDLSACAGMELTGGASPKVDSPNSNTGTPPDQGHGRHEPAPGNNDNDDRGTGPDGASPPGFVQPPGCIFREQSLELIV